MSKLDDLKAEYESKIAVAEAEDRLSASKAKKGPRDRELRNEVRALRQAAREQNPGGGTANPATIKTSAAPTKAGGK